MPEALTRIPTHAAIIVDGNRRWPRTAACPPALATRPVLTA